MYIIVMRGDYFEWDDEKAEANERQHDVSFYEAASVFTDAREIEFVDEAHSEEEGRYIAIGFSNRGRLLFVAFTMRNDRIRPISARLAERDEEELYEQNNR